MKVDELIRELRDIVLAHDQASEAIVWLEDQGHLFAIRFDTRHKPPRIILERAA